MRLRDPSWAGLQIPSWACASSCGFLKFLSEEFLDEGLIGVDADEFQPAGADIFESVRDIGGGHDNIARQSRGFLVAHGEFDFSLLHDPCLRIGMHMKRDPSTGISINEEDRYLAPVVPPFEANGAAFARLRVLMAKDCKHRILPS
ncbi:hypothetical protein EMEDMD4_1010011 [Sinorhizobium medicae]|uniref:Uncharacterized protein n=1 Tax=Sinorhizobium medicae TaxID=110321 RepID=A0A508WPH2_9HYPH|nr:hypothetical protein EMEDMD4_1010011 [Sinorhizobium medicae]